MTSMYSQLDKQAALSSERGSITIMAALFMSLLLLMVGLCIDVSRIYLVRAERQNAADAAALTAARELNGIPDGINSAVTKANAIINSQGLKAKSNVTMASIEFEVNLNFLNPMNAATASNPLIAPNIRFVRVTTTATTTSVLFALSALGSTHVESSNAVAGKSVDVGGICDFFPAAVALNDSNTDVDHPGFTLPNPGTLMTLRFAQGSGNTATLANKDFIILEIDPINGNGTGETAVLAAGVRTICKNLGDNINMTPSSNPNNGPRNAGDGMNTRFGVYANGYGNALNAATFPPDTNVVENIPHSQYVNGNQRRELVVPIIAPATYPGPYTAGILEWGVFFLRAKVPTPNGNCSNIPGCGSMPVEFVGKAQIGSAFGPPSCGSGLTTPVLYR